MSNAENIKMENHDYRVPVLTVDGKEINMGGNLEDMKEMAAIYRAKGRVVTLKWRTLSVRRPVDGQF